MKIPDTKVKDKHGTSYKTALCKYYSEDGKCKNEGNCHYAHGINELRMHLFYKTFLCKNAENCAYGKSCVYAHSERELRTFALNLKHGAEVPPGNYYIFHSKIVLYFDFTKYCPIFTNFTGWMEIPDMLLQGYKTSLCR